MLRKKQIGTICFIFSILIFPTYATINIPSGNWSADCNSSTLTTSDDNVTANLTAQYHANTISVTYDANGGTTSNGGTWTNNGATQCTYDLNFNLPTAPTKTGYNFDGWKVKCMFNSEDFYDGCRSFRYASLDSLEPRWKSIAGAQNPVTMEQVFGTENSADLNPGEWVLTYPDNDYAVKGEALCSTTSFPAGSDSWGTGTPNESGGGTHCWCRTKTTISNDEECSLNPSRWVFNRETDTELTNCADECAIWCVQAYVGPSVSEMCYYITDGYYPQM